MDSDSKAEYEAQCQELRVQLKTWENDWATSHGGRKPGRDDIKQNPDIAQKYKQYNKIRDILSGKTVPQPPQDRKRKQPELPPATPSKRTRPTQTPQRSSSHTLPADLPGPPAEITTPSISRQLFSPAVPTSIGPTPQRDGRVLGLFDLLGQTPSRSTSDKSPTQLASTPRKSNAATTSTTPRQLGRTPVTAGRFIQVAGLTTPLHERQNSARRTPSSSGRVSKLQFSTPAFLRRTTAPLPPVDENGEWKVGPLRLPKKPLVRSLSNMVAGLRRMEEEAFDEELDVMREMEMEAEGAKKPEADKSVVEGDQQPNKVEVADSQVVEQTSCKAEKPVLLGGFDDENLYDSSAEEQLDRGQPLRVYKKKGQKRTTRRSNLKPTRTKRPCTVTEDDGSDEDVVPETQFDATKTAGEPDDDLVDALVSGSDFDGESSDEEEQPEKKKKPAGKAKTASRAGAGKEKEQGTVKKVVRKVKATAHANFKRLKLRNTGSKGGPAHNSRFRRRR